MDSKVPPPPTHPAGSPKPPSTNPFAPMNLPAGIAPPKPPVLNPDFSKGGTKPSVSVPAPIPPKIVPRMPKEPSPMKSVENPVSATPPPRPAPPPIEKVSSLSTEAPIPIPQHSSIKVVAKTEELSENLLTPVSSPASSPEAPAESDATKSSEDKKGEFEYKAIVSGNLFSWISNAVSQNKILNDVAEKAKVGMEQVLTTLDPSMKSFLAGDEPLLLHVAEDQCIHRSLKEGFEKVFATVAIRAVPFAASSLPPLVLGFSESLKLCRERVKRVLDSKLIPPISVVIVIQPFLIQGDDQCTYTATRLFLRWKEHEITAVGQLLELSADIVDLIEKRTAADGKSAPQYSLGVVEAVKQLNSSVDDSWTGENPPYGSGELLTQAATAIAQKFMALHTSFIEVESQSK